MVIFILCHALPPAKINMAYIKIINQPNDSELASTVENNYYASKAILTPACRQAGNANIIGQALSKLRNTAYLI